MKKDKKISIIRRKNMMKANIMKNIIKMDNNMNMMSNTMSNNSNNSEDFVKIDYNKILSECTTKQQSILLKELENIKVSEKSKYKTIEEYENSFTDLKPFNKILTKKIKDSIDVIIFNKNNDGFLSGFIVWKYLIDNGKNPDDIQLYMMKPYTGAEIDYKLKNIENDIKNKTVIILDLDMNFKTLDYLELITKNIISIDEHVIELNRQKLEKYKFVFKGENHAACAYTFKIFFPKNKTNFFVLFVDNSDHKLFLPFVPLNDIFFQKSMGIRFVRTTKYGKDIKVNQDIFDDFNNFYDEGNFLFWLFVGKYMEEYSESLKFQIAVNAQSRDFQGYRVGVMNFNAPELSKKVARQIVSNFNNLYERSGDPKWKIDFAVLWGYEYTKNAYSVQLLDDHKQTKINLGELAKKLANIGGERGGGGGHQHVGHFYWPHNERYDIFDLFDKKLI
jgi:hypothetical protein